MNKQGLTKGELLDESSLGYRLDANAGGLLSVAEEWAEQVHGLDLDKVEIRWHEDVEDWFIHLTVDDSCGPQETFWSIGRAPA